MTTVVITGHGGSSNSEYGRAQETQDALEKHFAEPQAVT